MPKPTSSKTRDYIVMTREDAIEFSRALVERWPNMRFVPYDYWNRLDERGIGVLMQPPDLELQYFEHLWDPVESQFRAWLEPPKWKPKWRLLRRSGYSHVTRTYIEKPDLYEIVNEPPLQFYFDSSFYKKKAVQLGMIWNTPREYPEPDTLHIKAGRLFARYRRTDKEHKRFLGQVWRMSEKFTTNWLVAKNPLTNKFLDPPEKSGVWAGYHALEWCRQDPLRYIESNWRPADDYPDEAANKSD